jgi:hypothetical protein
MKPVKFYTGVLTVLAFVSINALGQAPVSTPRLSPADKKIVKDFEKGVKNYVSLREKIRKRLPKIGSEATAEQITNHKTAFQTAVRNARVNAKPGDIFTPASSALIKRLIKDEFKGWERNELRKTVLEADTKGVPLKINYPYPESKELVEMPPTLLLDLPQIHETLRYRFIGRSLVILDRDISIIVDFMREGLP